jgi:hypothetical protein
MNAEQQTRHEESMSFSSLNLPSSFSWSSISSALLLILLVTPVLLLVCSSLNSTAIKGFNNLVDHSVRGEGDFNEQERRTLENATTGWWKSNGVDFTEDKTDSSTKSTTEGVSIDSGRAVWGKAVSLMFGATGSIGMNAEQQTRDEESMSFNSQLLKPLIALACP